MPLAGPALLVALAIVAITSVGAATLHWAQKRNATFYREIDADIRQTLRQRETRKQEFVATERAAPPPVTTGTSTGTRNAETRNEKDAQAKSDKTKNDKIKDDKKARKAKTASIRKRAPGHRRERFVPPDFARLPIAIARGAFGFLR